MELQQLATVYLSAMRKITYNLAISPKKDALHILRVALDQF